VGWCSWTTLPAAVQPPFEPGGERLAAGEGVSDAPAALRKRRGAEEGGGRGYGEAQSAGGAGGVAKSMRGYLAPTEFSLVGTYIWIWVGHGRSPYLAGELKVPHTQGLKLSPKQKHQKATLAELLSPAIRKAVALLLQGQDLARPRERLSWDYLAWPQRPPSKLYFSSLPTSPVRTQPSSDLSGPAKGLRVGPGPTGASWPRLVSPCWSITSGLRLGMGYARR